MRLLLFFLVIGALAAETIHLTVEHARTEKELKWGLMGRKSLPPDHGMLFHFPKTGRQRVWMFNCLIPLSAAFLDEKGQIIEIHQLMAYPDMMKYHHPINSYEDLNKVSANDPIVQFFIAESIVSGPSARYALEMPLGWFAEKGVNTGDYVLWDAQYSEAKVLLRKSPN